MGNVPGLTNKTKNAESDGGGNNGTKDGTTQARETIPHEPAADKMDKIQEVPQEINAEKLPFVEKRKRFQIPTKICGKISRKRRQNKKSCSPPALRRYQVTHKVTKQHKISRRSNKNDDLMEENPEGKSQQPLENSRRQTKSAVAHKSLQKSSSPLSTTKRDSALRDDTNSPFASINNPGKCPVFIVSINGLASQPLFRLNPLRGG